MFAAIWKKPASAGWLLFAFWLLVHWSSHLVPLNNVTNYYVCLALVLWLWQSALVCLSTRHYAKKLRPCLWNILTATCWTKSIRFCQWFTQFDAWVPIVESSVLTSALVLQFLLLICGARIFEFSLSRIDPGNVRNACATDTSRLIAVLPYTAALNVVTTTTAPLVPRRRSVRSAMETMMLILKLARDILKNTSYVRSKLGKTSRSLRQESLPNLILPLFQYTELLRLRQPAQLNLPRLSPSRLTPAPQIILQLALVPRLLLRKLCWPLSWTFYVQSLMQKTTLMTKLKSFLRRPLNIWVTGFRLNIYVLISLLLLVPQFRVHLTNPCLLMAVPPNITQSHRFLQWNINGVRAQHGSLLTLLTRHNPSVVGLQETCLKPSIRTNLTFGTYSVYRHDRTSGAKGGVALLVRNSLPQIRVTLPHFQRLEAIAVKAHLNDIWITFVSIYDPHGNAPLADLEALMRSVNTPVFLMGDFNAHHPLWGDSQSDTQGMRLSDWFLDQDNLALLNDGSPTRLSRNHSQRDTAIDLTFVSSALTLFLQWSTLGDYGSDHSPILIDSCLRHSSTISVPPRWVYAKADWRLFRETLNSADIHPPRGESIESEVEIFTHLVLQAAAIAIPMSSGTVSDSPRVPPWWSVACAAKLRLAAVARRRAGRTKNLADRVHARKLTAISKLAVRDAKQKSWRSFCSSRTSSCNPGRAWNMVRWFRTGSQIIPAVPPLSVNGVSTTTPLAAATALASHFQSPLPHLTTSCSQPVEPDPIPVPLFTQTQLRVALRHLKNTAPGADGISALILNNLSEPFLAWLLVIYNRCLIEGVMPKKWKNGTVLAFLKPGKDPTMAESYRPITLLSVLGKVLERLIKERLEWHLESKGLRYNKQTGFRKGRRSIDNVVHLYNAAKKAMLTSGACLAVFLDIKDAFGSARHADILASLLKLGVDASIYKFFQNYLSDRTACVRVGTSLSAPYELFCGVPQGAVLSPILFSILLDDLANTLPPGLELVIYADDIIIFHSGPVLVTLSGAVQRGLDAVTTLLQEKGFLLSPSKCSAVCFTRKQRAANHISLRVNGSPLPLSPSCRYLGVIFDQRLTWRPYIAFLHAQCTRLLSLLRAVVGSSWGADRSSMRMFYTALIRTRLDYAAAVYREASTTNLQCLDRVQNAALRLILGTPRSTSIAAMELEAYLPPLPIQRDLLTLKYYAHCRTSPTSHFVGSFADAGATYSAFKGSADNLCRDWALTDVFDGMLHCAPASTWPPWHPGPFTLDIDWLSATKADLATCVTSSLFQHHLSKVLVANSVVVYTDGSVQPNAPFSGFAFHVPQFGVTCQYRADPRVSICRVELSALVLAIMWLLGRGIYHAVLCSDSISALQLLSSVDTVDPLRCALFRTMAQHPNVRYRLLWVPSHVGVSGNETADLAAKNAVHNPLARYVAVPPDSFYISRCIRQAALGKWQEHWTNADGGRFLFSIQPTILRSVVFGLSLGRRVERLLALARVNRFPTRNTLFRFNLSQSQQCPTCLVDDTLDHRFRHCPLFTNVRNDFHSALDQLPYPHSSRSLVALLTFQAIPSSMARPVLTFLGRFLSSL